MEFQIKNFRSIRDQTVTLAPITVLYGPNGAGKSSLLYALLTMRNVVLNSNQSIDGFFTYPGVTLGGFENVVFDHDTELTLELALSTPGGQTGTSAYGVEIGERRSAFTASLAGPHTLTRRLKVAFPYALSGSVDLLDDAPAGALEPSRGRAIWNGIVATAESAAEVDAAQFVAIEVNRVPEILRRTTLVPLRRGFSKPLHNVVGLSSTPSNEDEIATALLQNKYLVPRVSRCLKQVCGRDLRTNVKPGTSIFSLDASDDVTGVSSELVNEGFGVNQLVYLFARCLDQQVLTACIEEPEIHLHPSAIRALARSIVDISRTGPKRFVVATHSEALLTGLLAEVSREHLAADDLACYLVTKHERETRFERQTVSANGQIEGGLGSFIEGELEDFRAFMKITD